MTLSLLLLLGLLVLFLLGVLVGTGLSTREQDVRGRRQAATQRDLNLQFRALQEQQETYDDEMR